MKWPCKCKSEREQIIEKDKVLYELATAWRAAIYYRNNKDQDQDNMRCSMHLQRLENALNSLASELLGEE